MKGRAQQTWVSELLSNRQVIPRWRTPDDAANSGERDGVRINAAPAKLSRRWLDLVEQQTHEGRSELSVELEELHFVLTGRSYSWGSEPPAVVGRLQGLWQQVDRLRNRAEDRANPTSGDLWLSNERQRIGEIKNALSRFPNQPLLWAELARLYLTLGSDERSVRAMACALQLATKSSYIRRSASRMFLHLNDQAQALRVVREHPGITRNPRMVAAEVALSGVAKAATRLGKHGFAMMDDANYSPASTSDLGAALATLEMNHGKHKRARKLFARALVSPSDNALAQAQWAAERDSGIHIPVEAWTTPYSFEAAAMAARARLDWDGVLEAAERWLQDEPFAMRPAGIATFACFDLGQNARSEKLASIALRNHPGHRLLLNNRAVARCYLGDLPGAEADLREAVAAPGEPDAHLVATLGLLAYRSGDVSLGMRSYSNAIATFAKEKNAASLALAALFWLREEVRIGAPDTAENLIIIEKGLGRLGSSAQEPEIVSMLAEVKAGMAGETKPLLFANEFGPLDLLDVERALGLGRDVISEQLLVDLL